MIKDQKDQTSKIRDKTIKDQKMMVKYIESTKASLDKRIWPSVIKGTNIFPW